MGEKKDKSWIKSAINKLKKEKEELESQHKKLEHEIERLNKAKSNLISEMKNFEAFQQKVKTIKTTVSTGDFKGTLREQFDTKVQNMDSQLQTEQNTLQSNMSQLEALIAQKELKSGDLIHSISNLSQSIFDLLKSLA